MQHIKSISDIFDVPIIIVGDFNMLLTEFNDSCWCARLKASLVLPPTPTTLSKTSDRLIDYIVVSDSIRHIIEDVTAVQDTPWRHHGIAFKLNARPRALHSTSLMRPKALPLAEATQVYSVMNDFQKYQAYLKASRKARDILNRQRGKTGVAILGTPHPVLKQDIKYDAQYGKAAVATGEKLAQASLTSELMVCGLAEVPHKQYTGRGQYPKFRSTPIAPSCPTVVPSMYSAA